MLHERKNHQGRGNGGVWREEGKKNEGGGKRGESF